MARLDSLIAALFTHHGTELTFRTGTGITLKVGENSREIMQKPLTQQQVDAVMREIMPTTQPMPEIDGGAAIFQYRAPAGEVQVLFERFQTHARVLVTPALEKPAEPAPQVTKEALSIELLRGYSLDALLQLATQQGASDVHLRTGLAPIFRIDGELAPLQSHPPLEADFIEQELLSKAPAAARAAFQSTNDAEFAFEIHDLARIRVTLLRDRLGPAAVAHLAPLRAPSLEELGFGDVARGLFEQARGLLLVASASGQGKSTTFASVIDHLNRTRAAHIVTVEDPIEYVLAPQKAVLTQREVGPHTLGTGEALRRAFRADVDVVGVGVLDELDAVGAALKLAEAGKLVVAVVNAPSATLAIASIIERFPPERQSLVRASLANTLVGVSAQVLVRKKGGGRVAAVEVLASSPDLRQLLLEGRLDQLPALQQSSRGAGSLSLDDALADLVRRGLVVEEEALRFATSPAQFFQALGEGASAA